MEYAANQQVKDAPLNNPEQVPDQEAETLVKSLASRLAELYFVCFMNPKIGSIFAN